MNGPVAAIVTTGIASVLLFFICLIAKAPLDGLGLVIIIIFSLFIGLVTGAIFRDDPTKLPKRLNKRY